MSEENKQKFVCLPGHRDKVYMYKVMDVLLCHEDIIIICVPRVRNKKIKNKNKNIYIYNIYRPILKHWHWMCEKYSLVKYIDVQLNFDEHRHFTLKLCFSLLNAKLFNPCPPELRRSDSQQLFLVHLAAKHQEYGNLLT